MRYPLLALWMVCGVCQADSANEWLERMDDALREQNYRGTFTYMRGSQFETIDIVHKFADGNERERLLRKNGEAREILRVNGEVICYHLESDASDMKHDVPLGPFSAAFNDRFDSDQEIYKITERGADRVAGRAAVKLQISPKYDDRFGYRLWLDQETGLLLQSHLVERDHVRELFQFTSIEIGGEIPETMLSGTLQGDVVSHSMAALPVESGDVPAEKPALHVNWVPDGFKPIRTRQKNRLHFSDGLARLSVFLEQNESNEMSDLITRYGATAVITRGLGARGQITVVGEVPISTAQKVADSVVID